MISTSGSIGDSFEDKKINSIKDFSRNVQSLSLDSEYYVPNHRQARCGCFAWESAQCNLFDVFASAEPFDDVRVLARKALVYIKNVHVND